MLYSSCKEPVVSAIEEEIGKEVSKKVITEMCTSHTYIYVSIFTFLSRWNVS